MPRRRNNSRRGGRTVVLGVTGSIAAYKAAELASRLRQNGMEVLVVMTPSAGEFIRPLTFQALTGRAVYSDPFRSPEEWDPQHVSLARKADAVVVAPATADFLGKVAAGLADDLLGAVVMATRAPVLFAPAMNAGMFANPIVQENLAKLKRHGYRFIGPEAGHLACGEEGIGRLASVPSIISELESLLKNRK